MKRPLSRIDLERADVAAMVMADEFLRTSLFVRALGDQALEFLRRGVGRRYADRVTVFRQAEQGDSLFLVLRGEVGLSVFIDDNLLDLGMVSKGDVIGEGGDNGRRSLTAVAVGSLDLVELSKAVLLECGQGRPELLQYLSERQERRQASRDELAAFLNRW